jgi:hypothetical protein
MKSFGGRVKSGALFSIALLVFIGLALDLVSPAAFDADTKSSAAAKFYRPFLRFYKRSLRGLVA